MDEDKGVFSNLQKAGYKHYCWHEFGPQWLGQQIPPKPTLKKCSNEPELIMRCIDI